MEMPCAIVMGGDATFSPGEVSLESGVRREDSIWKPNEPGKLLKMNDRLRNKPARARTRRLYECIACHQMAHRPARSRQGSGRGAALLGKSVSHREKLPNEPGILLRLKENRFRNEPGNGVAVPASGSRRPGRCPRRFASVLRLKDRGWLGAECAAACDLHPSAPRVPRAGCPGVPTGNFDVRAGDLRCGFPGIVRAVPAGV